MKQEWWGIYDTGAGIWRTENQRSNYDDFIGKLICYPSRSIAEAHLGMIIRMLKLQNVDAEQIGKHVVRRFE